MFLMIFDDFIMRKPVYLFDDSYNFYADIIFNQNRPVLLVVFNFNISISVLFILNSCYSLHIFQAIITVKFDRLLIIPKIFSYSL